MEFAQWLYALYNQQGGENSEYDARDRRGQVDIDILGMKINKAGITNLDSNVTKTQKVKTAAPTLNNKMKLNTGSDKVDSKHHIKLPESKKENVPVNQNVELNSGRASRPIKKITGVNNNANFSESEELINKVKTMVSTEENPCIIVANIRSMLGVELSADNWVNVMENGIQASQRVAMVEDQYKQLYMQCQSMHNENKLQKQQIETLQTEKMQMLEELQKANMNSGDSNKMAEKQQSPEFHRNNLMEEENLQNERQTPSKGGSNDKVSMSSPNHDAHMLLEDDVDGFNPNDEDCYDPNDQENEDNLIEG